MDILFVFQIINTIFFGIFGLVIGSFLNVCIYRIPEGRTVVKGHSMCMSCGHNLGAPDLIPLFSWVFLKGKCRYCGSPVSSRYAKIEGLAGLVFAGLAWQRREFFYLPGASPEELAGFLSLLILLGLSALIIVSMMIQKDHLTGMYRFSASVSVLYFIRIMLCFFDQDSLRPVVSAGVKSLLTAAVILIILIIFSPFEKRPPGMFISDIFTGKSIRTYFIAANRTIRTTDLLFVAVAAAVGMPAAIPCLFAYAVVRTARNQENLLPYLGIVIAVSALSGVIIFPGTVF